MSRIQPINYESATPTVKQLLDGVQRKLGVTPKMVTTMAQSPAVLEAYVSFSGALAKGELNARLREQIALVSAEVNACGYCASAHNAIAKTIGLSSEQIWAARNAHASDSKSDATLRFARDLILKRGEITDSDFRKLRDAGLSDAEIAEVIAHVALNIFTNYFNLTAKTEIDFPEVEIGAAALATPVI
ncbi:MAG TPA: peroxidase-related enzyme [Pyrinomonadaceae bacterium]|nr:peroxidase-related enzyme [Pyrinomonadaceae bacterium]